METEKRGSVRSGLDVFVAMGRSQLLKKQVCKEARITLPQLNKILNGEEASIDSAERLARYLDLTGSIPPHRRGLREWEMRDSTAAQMRRVGFRIDIEVRLTTGRRVDLVAYDQKGSVLYIVEAKVTDPLSGIGQLLADRIEMSSAAQMVLLLRSDAANCDTVWQVCKDLGIEIWVDYFKGPRVAVASLTSVIRQPEA